MTLIPAAVTGVGHELEIEGAYKVLNSDGGVPIVFLLPEHHRTPADTETPLNITQNIANAEQLILYADVDLIGVESHPCYLGELDAGTLTGVGAECNNSPDFANHFLNRNNVVLAGVESPEIFGLMTADFAAGKAAGDIATYSLNYIRSYYYVSMIFRQRAFRGLDGNVILTAGGDHIEHIAQMVGWGGIHQIAGTTATYIRVRPTAYPA